MKAESKGKKRYHPLLAQLCAVTKNNLFIFSEMASERGLSRKPSQKERVLRVGEVGSRQVRKKVAQASPKVPFE